MLTFLASLILPFIVQFVATIRKEARPDVASYPCKAGSSKEKIGGYIKAGLHQGAIHIEIEATFSFW